MKGKTFSGLILIVLLTGILTSTINIQPVKASGIIYIRFDGSIDPPTAPITTTDNVTYTFTGNINDHIVVERNNIIINGADCTLQGTETGTGIDLSGRSNVTIKNTNIKNFDYGVYLHDSSNNNTISGNNITNNWSGVRLESSSNNTISGNNITNNGHGVRLDYSSNNNKVYGNTFINDGLDVWESYGNVVEDNTVNGKPLVYLEGVQNYSVSDAGQVMLFNCNNITVQNLNLSNTDTGVQLLNSNSCSITGNNIINNWYGVYLYSSSNNIVSGNNIINNSYVGVLLQRSSYNILRNNHLVNNTWNFGLSAWALELSHFMNDVDVSNTVDGKPIYYWVNHHNEQIPSDAGYVALVNSTNITVKGLKLKNNVQSILLACTTSSQIINNSIANNNVGVYLYESSFNRLSKNHVKNNDCGIWVRSSNDNTIYGNNIINNCYGVWLDTSSGNSIYHNNFTDNAFQAYSYGSVNTWDDGYPSGGNYWSDYTDEDLYGGPYQNETGSDGIWDHPYVIDMDNQDRYPLMNPWTPTSHKFRVGDWVQTTTNLNVREGPGLNYTIISTMALGIIGQILGGSVEADGYVWWDVDYAVGVRGWSVENWLELYPVLDQPPTCVVKLQKDGVEIDEIDVWDFFDIYVGDSTGDKGIKQVRFSSDNVQDGYPTGRWTEWYDWYVSSEDWNTTTKIKRWAFATPGYKEVWAEVKDEIDQTAVCLARIFVPAPALPVLTSPLVITPVKDIYNVGDSLEAEFTIKNIGDTAIALDVLTVGGRLNGFIPPEGAPDFTFQSITLQPDEQYQYQESLTLTQTGNYRFFVAYHIENPTPDEERLLDENNWNTCVELGEGLTHTDRVKNIIVFEEGTVPEQINALREQIDRLKKQHFSYPPYLLEVDSWNSAVSTLWADFTSFITRTDLREKYDELYQTGFTYQWFRIRALIDAGNFLDRGDIANAKKYLQRSYKYDKLSCMSFGAAAQVFDGNMAAGQVLAEGIREGCEAATRFGIAVVCPAAAVKVDAFYMGINWVFNTELEGWEQATIDLVIDIAFTEIFKIVQFINLDYNTLENYVNTVSTKVPLDKLLGNKEFMAEFGIELKKVIIHKIAEGITEEAIEKIVEKALRYCESMKDSVQIKTKSPVELRVIDSKGQITGLVNNEVKHDISMSLYYNETVTILFPADTYQIEVLGTDEGTYGLETTLMQNGQITTFDAIDIPVSINTTHQYTVDWDALSAGKEGVTIQVDSDGDGVFEHTFTSDSELTHCEFMLQTATVIDFDPDALDLWSEGSWITVYIELPEGYNVSDIDVSTILLNGTIPVDPDAPTAIGDYDNDGILDLMVKFNRTAVISCIINEIGYPDKFATVTLTVTGQLIDDTPFEGSDTIKIIDPRPRGGSGRRAFLH